MDATGAARIQIRQKDRLEWLKSTHRFRVGLREQWIDNQWKTESKQLEVNLRKLWNSTKLLPIERRKQIFELWDQYAEITPIQEQPKGNPKEFVDRSEEIGERARTQIYRFIGENMAKESGKDYSEKELSQLNQKRKSRQDFDPYSKR